MPRSATVTILDDDDATRELYLDRANPSTFAGEGDSLSLYYTVTNLGNVATVGGVTIHDSLAAKLIAGRERYPRTRTLRTRIFPQCPARPPIR